MTAQPFKMLGSYAYYRTVDLASLVDGLPGARPLFFGDSGAHSARTLGINLTLDDYAAWCRRWDRQLTVYSNLDVIGAPEATYANQKALEAKGLRPMPVFHTGTPWHWLERYLDEGYTYIALGKLLGNPIKHVMPWLAKAFRLAQGRAVFHGFGMTVWPALREFPFYSVDSSTWGSGARYGDVSLFNGRNMVRVRLRDKAAVLAHRDLIALHGADPAVLASKANYDRRVVVGVCAVAYHRAEDFLRRRHGPIALPDGPYNPVARQTSAPATDGLHLHLADTWDGNLTAAAAGLHLYLAETCRGDLHSASSALDQYARPAQAKEVPA
ncbi:hypothetical protein JNUCC0626_19960 [Lentzea sp. JNUCC 0626]|uniref:hypothetical protein n=1 Tax=Lentzea sp. JNUCC 0626 TaxID=3367513 RepID=UPI003747E2AD